MRIYNGKGSVLNLPLINSVRLEILPHTVSREFLPTTSFIDLLVKNFRPSEIAIIVSGPFEITMCANVSASDAFVVNSLDEALRRFEIGKKPEEPKVEAPAPEPEPVKEEVKVEEEVKEDNSSEDVPEAVPEVEVNAEPEAVNNEPVPEAEVAKEESAPKKHKIRKTVKKEND